MAEYAVAYCTGAAVLGLLTHRRSSDTVTNRTVAVPTPPSPLDFVVTANGTMVQLIYTTEGFSLTGTAHRIGNPGP